ncbi:uncharacterized protein DUF1990 [Pseudonocardia sediminis]|uniref:Uncharacterized protein DUF1990 n=2 Tax=Pseudonocardia sediminis TaxID=1397368 RepID=A0A4Q7UUH3_PSEST|nr:uncharacterized protein DUF1990 [Pseudonocardia sediminis]
MYRSEETGDASDMPPELPPETDDGRIQPAGQGYGPLLHRRYSVRIEGARIGPVDLMTELKRDPNRWAPDFAVFRQTRGDRNGLDAGDEFLIRMPGPWNGPVRIVAADPGSFRFATLQGHLEAGQIEFRTGLDDDGLLRFDIESWARPGDVVSHLLYNRLPVAKEIQLVMWTHACASAAELAGGHARDGVDVHTRRVADPRPS